MKSFAQLLSFNFSRSRRAKPRIEAFVAAYLLAGTAFGMTALLLPAYAVRLDIDTWIIGMIQAGLMLGLALMILPAGFLVDRYGSRRLFIASAFATGLTVLVLPALSRPVWLLPAVLLMGAFSSFNAAAANAAFFNSLPEMGADKAGWYKGAWMAGLSLAGPLLAGYAIPAFGPAGAFKLIALLWITQGLAAWIFTSGRLRRVGSASDVNVVDQVKSFFADRRLVGAAALEGISVATVTTFSTFITVMILRQLELSPGHAGLLISLQGIGYALMLFRGHRLLRRLTGARLMLCGLCGVAVAFAVFATVPNFAAVAGAALVLGLALGLLGLTNISPLSRPVANRGSLVGFYGLGMGLFSFTGVSAAGLIGRAGGLAAVFWHIPVLYLALILLVALKPPGPDGAWI